MAVRSLMRRLITCGLALAGALPLGAQTWRSMGPPGGDVRTLAASPGDPRQIYLGTSDGHIFGSRDAGIRWQILGRAGTRQDGVVTSILVDPRDPRTLYAGLWSRHPSGGGGVFKSTDSGHSWQGVGLEGQSIRALAQAPSDPDLLVAGTLDGIYRSRNSGRTWQRISPPDHEEIRNLDSVAIDPRDADVIYAGTFHLPWKTVDGGRTWAPIHAGMIDDSDVMAIVIDRSNPRRLYASACSGIYRSDNQGGLWKKIQGIPFAARRTHVIQQDPRRPQTVFAGTTEGLWKTTDAGVSWRRITPAHWVINALLVDSQNSNRLVMGTDQLGVLTSDDGGASFRVANEGFHHRQIVALALDRDRPGRVLAVLANAPEPLLATDDGGRTWSPLGPGLNTLGLRRVYASPDGWWAALERGGLMRYDPQQGAWGRVGHLVGEAAATVDRRGRRIPARGPRLLDRVVNQMAFSRDRWFLATPNGLLGSRDLGQTWELVSVGPMTLPMRTVRVSGDGRDLRVVSLRGMLFSRDAGQTWTWHDLPLEAGGAQRLEVADEQTVLAAAANGLFISRDSGKTWRLAESGLPKAPVQDVAVVGDVFVVSMQTRGLYISYDRGRTWSRIAGTLAEGFFPVVTALDSGAVIFAASASEGLFAVELDRKEVGAGSNGENPK